MHLFSASGSPEIGIPLRDYSQFVIHFDFAFTASYFKETPATFIRGASISCRPSPCGPLSGPLTVGSEEARSVALTLASVRRSNGACGFPALRFHKGTLQT
jgi:hypothetical protein